MARKTAKPPAADRSPPKLSLLPRAFEIDPTRWRHLRARLFADIDAVRSEVGAPATQALLAEATTMWLEAWFDLIERAHQAGGDA
jgi:hypothetical protein